MQKRLSALPKSLGDKLYRAARLSFAVERSMMARYWHFTSETGNLISRPVSDAVRKPMDVAVFPAGPAVRCKRLPRPG